MSTADSKPQPKKASGIAGMFAKAGRQKKVEKAEEKDNVMKEEHKSGQSAAKAGQQSKPAGVRNFFGKQGMCYVAYFTVLCHVPA